MNSKEKYISEHIDIINQMILENKPKLEIARILNIKYDTLNKYFKKFNIDYAGNQNRKGIAHTELHADINDYLTLNGKYIKASLLRLRLIKSGLKEEKCECCGLTMWMGKKIPLELHHKNGNHYDNRLENLQVLCSNCHSIAHNYSN